MSTKGKTWHWSLEARKRQHYIMLGRKPSATQRRNMSLAQLGRKHTAETKLKMRNNQLGEKNTMWRGDVVGKGPLHDWIRYRKPQPSSCECCGKVTSKLDLANISGWYYRDVNDFEYLCRRCHMHKDRRLEKFLSHRKSFPKGYIGYRRG